MKFYPINHEAIFDDIEKLDYPNRKIGVITHIENDKGEQQRKIKSHDDNGPYEDIGGKVDSTVIYHCHKNNINWIFVIYFVKHINGDYKIMEPGKCIGYRFFSYNDVLTSNEVTEVANI